MELKIEVKNIDELVKRFEKAPEWTRRNLKSALEQSLKLAAENARKSITYKQKTGNLERSIETQILDINTLRGRVWLNPDTTMTDKGVSYGVFLHEGTGIFGKGKGRFFVKPVNWKAMRWVGSDGKHWFSKGHWINGVKPNPFIYIGAEKSRAEINAIFQRQVDRAIRASAGSGRIMV